MKAENEPKWVTDYNNQQEIREILKKSTGFKSQIFSRYEGLLEVCVDEIRSAKTSLEALSILSIFIQKFLHK